MKNIEEFDEVAVGLQRERGRGEEVIERELRPRKAGGRRESKRAAIESVQALTLQAAFFISHKNEATTTKAMNTKR